MSEADDLGPRPDPQIEPGEVNPGGIDAVAESDGIEAQHEPILPRDLDPDDNPATGEFMPGEMKEREDTGTGATRSDSGDSDVAAQDESSA